MEILKQIKNFGFSEHTYSEVILSIRHKDKVNVAPMGVLLGEDENLHLRVYKGQRTCRMIMDGAEDCILNITDDPRVFYDAVFRKDRIAYCPSQKASSPRICGCNAYVECIIINRSEREELIEVSLKPILISVSKHSVIAYHRAGPAVIEALICYTKLLHFRKSDRRVARELRERMQVFKDIVYHSTRKRDLRMMIKEILERAQGC
ncbi:MAG TPA: DUF447 family protein [Candidatus Bathyarchaeota archaeon]|nr:DUF447 family protein [Candidatus Bathyarchaeota archaeon]